MQTIKILRRWILQGCKIYRLCIVADLIEMCFRIDEMSR